jgi:hypothetical protein
VATISLQPVSIAFRALQPVLVSWSQQTSPVLDLRSPVAGVVDLAVDSPHIYLDPQSPKVLSEGRVTVTASRIFICPPGKVAVITLVDFVNVSVPAVGTPELVVLYFSRGVRRELGQALLQQTGWRFQFLEDPIELEAGDVLLAETTNPNSVDFVISGFLSNAGGGP